MCVAIPLRGSVPCNKEPVLDFSDYYDGESQSPYGAQYLATL